MHHRASFAVLLLLSAACGGDDPDPCEFTGFEVGGDGVSQPLNAGPGEARAGRILASDLPATPLGMAVWAGDDFVLANDRIALVIEDVGPSDLYDPWGGRPVGLSTNLDGDLVSPADFGEFFLLTGRYSVVTESVSVLADGSDGGAAIIRASGPMSPLPFFEAITGALVRDDLDGVFGAIDYVLEPDADHVDIRYHYFAPNENGRTVNLILHGFMYGERMPVYAPGIGFGASAMLAPYLGFIDDDATSYAYEVPGEPLGTGIAESGFSSNLTSGFEIPGCEVTSRDHARLTIGGPGLDGLRKAVARTRDEALRTITGGTRDAAGNPAPGVRVHAANDAGDYITRALSGADGSYELNVPDGAAVELFGFRRGDAIAGPISVEGGQATADISLAGAGSVHVVATNADGGGALPVRVQALASGGSIVPTPPRSFGEVPIVAERADIEFTVTGDTTLRLPVGEWEIVVSRGYEYELHREIVTVAEDATVEVTAVLARVVDTTGIMCADYHIHTIRSADGSRTAAEMAAAAIGDGLDILVRSDHEYVSNFESAIAELGMGAFAFGVASVEMTSMEIWGHFGVLPIEPVLGAVNNGTPIWQSFPTAADPEREFETFNPVDVFASVRQRPEGSNLIVNHPVGSTNYFGYARLDLDTAVPASPEFWDEQFQTIEALNGSSFRENRDRSIRAWFSILNSGRPMFVVGSSDAHGLSGQGTGYPRTCLSVGTDDPRSLTPAIVADATHAGRSSVVGGIFVSAQVSGAGPGETIATGASATLDLSIQAASWVPVETIEVIVDGVTVNTITVLPGDADPGNPTIRYAAQIPLAVASGGSWVVVAAYADGDLEPVTVGAEPFGVSNPIFMTP